MISATSACLERLTVTSRQEIVEWACPVPFFGDPRRARIATVGINPSNKEFVDDLESPLIGLDQRLPTRQSLGLHRWEEATAREVKAIDSACRRYFDGNSYDRWFAVLESVLNGAGATFYGLGADACHLDLVPFATTQKWGKLSAVSRRKILGASIDLFARIVADTDIHTLVLNGRSVVEAFRAVSAESALQAMEVCQWQLPRGTGSPVGGIAYRGVIHDIYGYQLARPMKIIGYNHNLQSSFGVTAAVKQSISKWVAREASYDAI